MELIFRGVLDRLVDESGRFQRRSQADAASAEAWRFDLVLEQWSQWTNNHVNAITDKEVRGAAESVKDLLRLLQDKPETPAASSSRPAGIGAEQHATLQGFKLRFQLVAWRGSSRVGETSFANEYALTNGGLHLVLHGQSNVLSVDIGQLFDSQQSPGEVLNPVKILEKQLPQAFAELLAAWVDPELARVAAATSISDANTAVTSTAAELIVFEYAQKAGFKESKVLQMIEDGLLAAQRNGDA